MSEYCEGAGDVAREKGISTAAPLVLDCEFCRALMRREGRDRERGSERPRGEMEKHAASEGGMGIDDIGAVD